MRRRDKPVHACVALMDGARPALNSMASIKGATINRNRGARRRQLRRRGADDLRAGVDPPLSSLIALIWMRSTPLHVRRKSPGQPPPHRVAGQSRQARSSLIRSSTACASFSTWRRFPGTQYVAWSCPTGDQQASDQPSSSDSWGSTCLGARTVSAAGSPSTCRGRRCRGRNAALAINVGTTAEPMTTATRCEYCCWVTSP